MSKHNFIESRRLDNNEDKYLRVIYCTWCGVVTWYFNRNEESNAILQKNAQTSCAGNCKKEPLTNSEAL